MLEEILKSMNENLVKIANVLGGKLDITIPQTPKANSMPTIQPEIINPIPTVQPATMAVVQTAIPVTPIQESFTQAQLACAMANAVAAGKQDIVLDILGKLGVQALTQVKPENYNQVASMLKEAGVEVK